MIHACQIRCELFMCTLVSCSDASESLLKSRSASGLDYRSHHPPTSSSLSVNTA